MQLEHHKRNELCTTRSRYREGRKLTAVKVSIVYIVIFRMKNVLSLIMRYSKFISFNITLNYKW